MTAEAWADRYTRFKDCALQAGLTITGTNFELMHYVKTFSALRALNADLHRDLSAWGKENQARWQESQQNLQAMQADLQLMKATLDQKAGRTLSTMEALRAGLQAFADFGEAITGMAKLVPEASKTLDELNGHVDGINKAMAQNIVALEKVNRSLVETKQAIDVANEGMAELNVGVQEITVGINEMNAAVDNLNVAMRQTNDSVAGMNKSIKSLSNHFRSWEKYQLPVEMVDQYRIEDLLVQEEEYASLFLDFIPGVGDVKGLQEAATGQNLVTGGDVDPLSRVLGGLIVFRLVKPIYKGADAAFNGFRLRGTLEVIEKANGMVDSLRTTGKLPPHFITQDEARAMYGWEKGAALAPKAPGKSLGGDVFGNKENVLPNAEGRTWYEADIGQDYAKKRKNNPGDRLLYSSDGLLYVSTDHYQTVYYVGTYK
ncbi:pre-toxin TG domain-containing protein [Actinoplanes sp. NPDC051859]|uniref:pre-toxin TG domain-containing protein n=1 Tax=Actinoplanes sp. NPDC051859 TaxID=3363909 RepID=UPI0037A140F5